MDPTRPAGRLVIFGGLGPRSWGDGGALRELLGPGGGPRPARWVHLSVGPRGHGRPTLEALRGLGAAEVRSLEVASRDDAGHPHAIGLVERASAVLLDGDDPGLVARLLVETRLDAALRRRLADSMALAARGAAASALGGWMLVEDHGPSGDGAGAVAITGMGYLPGAILDHRYARDGRLDRLRAAVADRPEALGLGLGEATALVVEGSTVEVRGRGPVAFLQSSGGPGSAGPTTRLLGPGDRLVLRSRAPGPPEGPPP